MTIKRYVEGISAALLALVIYLRCSESLDTAPTSC